MKTQLITKNLLACLEVASKKDVRYYLNGVNLDFCNDNEMVYVSTCGSVLIAIRALNFGWDELDGKPSPASAIIPREALAKALKGYKSDTIELELMGDGRYLLGSDTIFTPIDGKFPDYERVIPKTVSGEAGNYDPELYARAFKAVTIASGKNQTYIMQGGNKDVAVVLTDGNLNIVCVLMPCFHKHVDYTYKSWHKPSLLADQPELETA